MILCVCVRGQKQNRKWINHCQQLCDLDAKYKSSAMDLFVRAAQTPLMTNRTHTLTVILCSAKLRETATAFLEAQRGGQIAHRSLEQLNREGDFFKALAQFCVLFFFFSIGNVFLHICQTKKMFIHQSDAREKRWVRVWRRRSFNGFVGGQNNCIFFLSCKIVAFLFYHLSFNGMVTVFVYFQQNTEGRELLPIRVIMRSSSSLA